MMKNEIISIVIPAFNEEKNLSFLIREIQSILKDFSYEIIIVNDGSTDGTERIVEKYHEKDQRIQLISLSRNFGHQAALFAGLQHAQGNCIISIDADMEQPPYVMLEMISEWKKGADIVYSIHREAEHEGWFKKSTSRWFYRLFNFLAGIKLTQSCDFRLIDRKIVNTLVQLPERALFLRGIIPWMGFKSSYVYYTRGKRKFGTTHYTLRKMINLALNGIISFSVRPLHFIVLLGIAVGFIGCLSIIWIMYLKFFTNETIVGWSSLAGLILILGGAQLFIMGIIGEYIAVLVREVKQRPLYIIDKTTLIQGKKDKNVN